MLYFFPTINLIAGQQAISGVEVVDLVLFPTGDKIDNRTGDGEGLTQVNGTFIAGQRNCRKRRGRGRRRRRRVGGHRQVDIVGVEAARPIVGPVAVEVGGEERPGRDANFIGGKGVPQRLYPREVRPVAVVEEQLKGGRSF